MHIEIDERTRIPLFAVLGAIPIAAFVIFFLAGLSFRQDAAAARSNELELRQDRQGEFMREQSKKLDVLNERTARIESMLQVLTREKGH